ncbi:hypothetical protein FOL47_005199 [Perkinsus chesapeaki]|uniref:Uncharacterized protein n=1 Tax=Perkinsus chesapeaki TaxID=330153 RepID=A0A7J6LYP2_PERCH|nr:hypothetical protein FOL47_005199 [Perkinsus chesapeaki]
MSSTEEEGPPPDSVQEEEGAAPTAVGESDAPVESKNPEQPEESQQPTDQTNVEETVEPNAKEVVVEEEEQPAAVDDHQNEAAAEVMASKPAEEVGPQATEGKAPPEAPPTAEEREDENNRELMQESLARARRCAAELLSTVRLLSEELQGMTALPDLEQHLQKIRDNAEEIGKLGTLKADKEEEKATLEHDTSQNIESRPSTAERTDGGVAALKEIQQLRQQLHRGDGLTTIEETECEVEELKRVRRQIRYLFGGVLASLPTETAAISAMQSQAVELYYPQQQESLQHNRNISSKNSYGAQKMRVDDDASTYSLSSSNASIFTPHSPNDGRRKHDKHRTKPSVERQRDPKDSFTSDGLGILPRERSVALANND